MREEIRRVMAGGRPQWATMVGSQLRLMEGSMVDPASVQHLPPVEPSKIICLHTGYDSRRLEFRRTVKSPTPTYFHKPTTSLNSHEGILYRPQGCKYLNYEGELGVVIGRPMRNVTPEEALLGVAGYVPVNDVGCHDFRETDQGSMLRVKGMDSFCPVGPGLVRGIDVSQSVLRTYINGKVVQEDRVADMNFGIGYLISDLSRFMTWLPGDLLLTGTPANSRPMNIGDVVEVEITQVGRLRNVVAEAPVAAVKIGHQPTDTPVVTSVAFGGDWFDMVKPEAKAVA